jgi:hypothetical protein
MAQASATKEELVHFYEERGPTQQVHIAQSSSAALLPSAAATRHSLNMDAACSGVMMPTDTYYVWRHQGIGGASIRRVGTSYRMHGNSVAEHAPIAEHPPIDESCCN